jgi:acetyl esterase/lipase
MPRLNLALIVFGSIAFSCTLLHADDTPKKTYDVEKHLNIAYRSDKDADPVKHKLDIFTPKGQKDFPVMMFVHGGSWKSGNKELYASLGETFAKQGIGTVVINYRLSDSNTKAKHPDHIRDVAAAFAWVHDNIAKYGGRVDRIFISGHSAGAHLVSLLATDEIYLKEHKLGLGSIRGVMALSGVYEITPGFFAFNGPFGKEADVCKAASPINHVKAKDPPFLICYADKDLPTIETMSERFCKKLTDEKCEATSVKIDGRNHISIIIQLAISGDDSCTKAMLDFIAKHSEWKRPGK